MKKIIALIMAVAMILSLAACGSKPVEQPEDETIKLNIGYMPNYGSLWSVTTAIEKGYFEEAGIEVTLWEFADGPTIIAAMESGKIDMGYIGHGAHKLCIQGKAKIFALSHISNGDALIGGPNVKTLADLKGKTVGYTAGTSSEDILKNALAKANLTMADITAMEMGAENLTTAALSGSLDAVACWSPNSLMIMDEWTGCTKLADNVMFADTSVSLASWIVLDKYAGENADKVLAFTKALYKAMDYAADGNYEEVAQFVVNQTKTDYDAAYAERGVADWLTGKEVAAGAADGTVEAYYKTQQNNFIASGAVTAEVPVADYVMLQNMIDAAK
ncbi:MAG: transporter substrate-binding domain-containing protein [Ruminococcaceae bacterium]|nr:transporter substrate-binding domain-containing protein [Oscillospiraceae bacterium]